MAQRAKGHLACVVAGLGLSLFGINWPPHEIYPYVPDATDNPPVYYAKVCDPGVTGEENASYVILGIPYPRTYQAVVADYAGDLVIPETIDGLPVRKINDAAFLTCVRLTSVTIPPTVREIGERAFAWCTALTNVAIAEGVSVVGRNCFSNCVSLASVTFPKSLACIGENCFVRCDALEYVRFLGNAPRLAVLSDSAESYFGEKRYFASNLHPRLKVYIDKSTQGWIAPYVRGVPEKWPCDFGWLRAYETVAEGPGSVGVETGFMTVITEIEGGAVAVPESWAAQFPNYTARFGTDFSASLTRLTGKRGAGGTVLRVWQDYVAGTDPTDETDVFRAVITLDTESNPHITYEPQLPEAETAKRVYTIYGKKRLSDDNWTRTAEESLLDYNFFKVVVRMK